jgi:hypothetical protein
MQSTKTGFGWCKPQVQPRGYIHQGLHQIREIKNQTVKQIAGVLAQKLLAEVSTHRSVFSAFWPMTYSVKEQKRRIVHCESRTGDRFFEAARGTCSLVSVVLRSLLL